MESFKRGLALPFVTASGLRFREEEAHALTKAKLAIAVAALEKIQAECDDESFLEWQIAAEALAKIKGEE